MMENIRLNKFYNIIFENTTDYSDNLSELVDLIVKTKEEGKITDADANVLLKLVLSKEIKGEMHQLNKWVQLFNTGERKEKHSILFNLSSKEKKYA